MKLISWNVNGLRACAGKGFFDFFAAEDADVFCLQETKLQPGQMEMDVPGYNLYVNSAVKKGYSGTAVYTKRKPLSVVFDPIARVADEGRVIVLDMDEFYLVVCYTPNSQRELTRLSLRMEWEKELRGYLCKLDGIKPVVYTGDLNVAHREIDLKNPKSNRGNAGFTDEEREKMTQLLSSGFADSFRTLYPDRIQYSWWSYMANARSKGIGWRIDYFIVSERLMPRVTDSVIYDQVPGSDHCPVGLILD